MINIIVSGILEIVLPFTLSSAYFYLTELLLILIISPIILLIVTFSPSLPNKTKKFILYFNMFYSLSLLFIPELLLIILKYEMILNNMYMINYFSIFSLILAEIFELFIIIYVRFIDIYAIIVIISFIMIVLYVFKEIYLYESKETTNFIEYKKYINNYIINNKKFFIVASILSIILGAIFLCLVLKTHSSYYIRISLLLILLTATILSYILSFSQKNIKEILSKLSIDMLISWSSILLLSFSKVVESITNIFTLHSIIYQVVTYLIIITTILLLMFIISLYVYIVNTNRNLENMIKWIILVGFLIPLLFVYLFGNGSVWYMLIGLLCFPILTHMYVYIPLCILKNINKEDWNIIFGMVLTVYVLSSAILYPIIDNVLYAAMIFVFLAIIPLFIYCIIYCHRNNKEKDCNKQ